MFLYIIIILIIALQLQENTHRNVFDLLLKYLIFDYSVIKKKIKEKKKN